MKAILMSIRPQWVAKILNGEKTIEIRKKFPKGYVGWVYIYCTKKEPYARRYVHNDKWGTLEYIKSDGKVVARFWCDKVEDFEFCEFSKHKDNLELYNECIIKDNELCKKACISCVQMVQYLDTKAIGKDMFGKAIHITKLEIFDKPREISEFRKIGYRKIVNTPNQVKNKNYLDEYLMALKKYQLTRAPQSWCYVEV